jgi:hypothetical protein
MMLVDTARGLLRLRGWDAVVAASIALLALVGAGFAVGWLVSYRSGERVYDAPARVARVELRVESGSVTVVGGNATPQVRVRREEASAFGRAPAEHRSLTGRALRLTSSCPRVVVGDCSASYRLTVPDDVDVDVTTGSGRVRLAGFHGSATIHTDSGDVKVAAFCGFRLAAATGSGRIQAVAACAPKSLELSSVSGDADAVVPPGRYRVTASSNTGRRRVAGLLSSRAARFRIDVRSRSGDVTVEGGL